MGRRVSAAGLIVLGAGCLALGLLRFSSASPPRPPAPQERESTIVTGEGSPRETPSPPGVPRPVAAATLVASPATVTSTTELGLDAPVPALLGASAQEDPRSKQHVAFELGQRGGEDALEGLIALLGDADPEVRSVAAEQLERFDDERALDALAAALGGEDDEDVRQVLRASVERVAGVSLSAPP